MLDTVLEKLAEHGPWGLVCVILFLAYGKKERREQELVKQVQDEKDARIADNKAYNELSLRLQDKVTTTVQQLAEIYRSLPALGQKGDR